MAVFNLKLICLEITALLCNVCETLFSVCQSGTKDSVCMRACLLWIASNGRYAKADKTTHSETS